jgi:fructose-bisphosphate aldolase class I
VADATLQCLLRSVPAAVASISFLSGGQSGVLASVGNLGWQRSKP